MKPLLIIIFTLISIIPPGKDFYICKNAKISLYSSSPLEDIKGVTTSGASVYNPDTQELDFSVTISSFQFDQALMKEHFNTDYLESDKYPRAVFKGTIQQSIDITKDGTFPITVTGDLNVHGVTQKRTIPGTFTIKNGAITVASEFQVKCIDHNIKIPQLVFHNIAESIKMNVVATYIEYKK
ncbi:YceI family protein [Mucilaginibacter sp.]|uniref:YceI family protein n=1 Tax=Mucilaginibacter sp. TaxID=1882438 RepID=UPI0026396723|nr:YceI family protein [Mucilaginibacter sp.]MDB4926340.1 polyisoprenoid-binding protein [Mucilaginibacter sp.]